MTIRGDEHLAECIKFLPTFLGLSNTKRPSRELYYEVGTKDIVPLSALTTVGRISENLLKAIGCTTIMIPRKREIIGTFGTVLQKLGPDSTVKTWKAISFGTFCRSWWNVHWL